MRKQPGIQETYRPSLSAMSINASHSLSLSPVNGSVGRYGTRHSAPHHCLYYHTYVETEGKVLPRVGNVKSMFRPNDGLWRLEHGLCPSF